MSRFRMVFCAIWSDDKFPFLSDDAQHVWFHLYTNELSNGLGVYKASLEGLAADRRWPLERYRKGLGECLGEGLVEYDETFHVVCFPRFFRWNRPPNPNVLRSMVASWECVPNCELKLKQFERLSEAAKRWGEGFVKVLETFRETLPQTMPEKRKGKGKGKGEGEEEGEVRTASASRPPPRGTRLPDDFELTAERRAYAQKEGLDATRTFEKFVDYWRSAAGQNARKLDWDATWRNWCRREAEKAPMQPKGAGPPPARRTRYEELFGGLMEGEGDDDAHPE